MQLPTNVALILIDIQKGFDDKTYWGKRNNLVAEDNIVKLLTLWRKKKSPVFHIKHNSQNPKSPLAPGQSGNDIKESVFPLKSEPVITKTVNSAFIGTDLEKRLQEQRIDTVIIVGITTDHCVATTARMAGNLGFTTYVISDATATFDRKGFNKKHYTAETMHELALVSLHKEFATVLTTGEVLKLL